MHPITSAGTKANSSTTDDGHEVSSPNAAKPNVSRRYIADGLVVLKDGGVSYECDTADEAQAIAKAANEYRKKKKRDHASWEDLEALMNGG